MNVFGELESKLRKIDLDDMAKTAVLSSEDKLIKDLRTSLFAKGQKTDGTTITPQYTPFTKQIKASKGQPTDRVTLFDSGRLHASLSIKEENQGAKTTFTPSYGNKLKEKYGDDVLNVNFGNNKDKLISEMKKYILSNL